MTTFVRESPVYEGKSGQVLEYFVFVVAALGLAAALAITTFAFARAGTAWKVAEQTPETATSESARSGDWVWEREDERFDYMWRLPR